jgi:hypothetical protein
MRNGKKMCSIQIIYVRGAVKPVEKRDRIYGNEVCVLYVGNAM